MGENGVGQDERARVAVLATGHLVGETMVLALQAHGFAAENFPFPHARAAVLETRREISEVGAGIGIVVAEVNDVAQWRDVSAVIETIPLRWLLVTGSPNTPRWGGLLAAGCQGIVPMTGGLEALLTAVSSLASGGPGMDPEVRDQALRAWERLGPERRELIKRISALSPREWQVLGMLNEGHSITTIAEDGGVSEGTVRSQVRAIRQKLNVKSQLAAVAAYQEATAFDRV